MLTNKDIQKLTEVFGTKDEIVIKKEFVELKGEFGDFKNESLNNEDAMLKKLDILLSEKEVREYQEKKEKKLWAIIIKSLKEHRILSQKELKEISKLEIF